MSNQANSMIKMISFKTFLFNCIKLFKILQYETTGYRLSN